MESSNAKLVKYKTIKPKIYLFSKTFCVEPIHSKKSTFGIEVGKKIAGRVDMDSESSVEKINM